MSPEQATADKTITARSDIYSLASVLYEMLTWAMLRGRTPATDAPVLRAELSILTRSDSGVVSEALTSHLTAR